MPTKRLTLLVAATVAAALTSPSWGAPHRACTSPGDGGDWALGGHDLSGSRDQTAEHQLSPSAVSGLTKAWSFDTGHASGFSGADTGDLNATPVEAGGCVYVGTAASDGSPNLFALDVQTGAVVWERSVGRPVDNVGGSVVGSPAVDGDQLLVPVNITADHGAGPVLLAVDRSTGATRWQSPPVATAPGSYTNATPVVFRGVAVLGWSGAEGDPAGQGGVALVDTASGALLARTPTIPPDDQRKGFAGGGVWTTPVVDEATGTAYFGTGNPFSKKVEHPRTNALLKLDVRRGSATFGQVLASYKGDIEQLSPTLRTLSGPTCELLPDDPLRTLVPSVDPRLDSVRQLFAESHGCLQLDLDFGAGPNLFRDASGHLLLGDLQKSGVYHVVQAADMRPAWTAMIGVTCQLCNASSPAYDALRHLLVADVNPGSSLVGLSDTGTLSWRQPLADAVHYQPVSVADGVAYAIDGNGFLDLTDVATGLPITRRSLVLDGGTDAAAFGSPGVAIARHTVIAASGSHLVAYRAP